MKVNLSNVLELSVFSFFFKYMIGRLYKRQSMTTVLVCWIEFLLGFSWISNLGTDKEALNLKP